MASSSEILIPSADILRLIEAHLTEAGFHTTSRALRAESGVGAAGSLHSNWKSWAISGQWGLVLKGLAQLDRERCRLPQGLISDVHEMAILELAEAGEFSLAYATLQLIADEMNAADERSNEKKSALFIPRARQLEQKLAALTSKKAQGSNGISLPPDYYGVDSKQGRREAIGKQLVETIPVIPSSRLPALLQQAVKWQSFSGELPMIRDQWQDGGSNEPKRGRKRRRFDLVLGGTSLSELAGLSKEDIEFELREPIPSRMFSSISFGKKATAECAAFLRDGSGLVTGSSDGLIEIWDPHEKYKELRMDLPYQKNEEILGHEEAVMSLDVSNDGTMLASGDKTGNVNIWRLDSGKCLRTIVAHAGAVVSALQFSLDGSHVLTASHDMSCREFGLRNASMLKEFRGHSSYVNDCRYVLADDVSPLRVITASTDGTVRVWDGNSADVLMIMSPILVGNKLSAAGSSIRQIIEKRDDAGPSILSVLPMHTPAQSVILVPRGQRAFLVTLDGSVLQTYSIDATNSVIVAATVSPSNYWLYVVVEDGTCHVFDVKSGDLKSSIPAFVRGNQEGKEATPASAVAHHPTKSVLAVFSSDKRQKKGKLSVWK